MTAAAMVKVVRPVNLDRMDFAPGGTVWLKTDGSEYSQNADGNHGRKPALQRRRDRGFVNTARCPANRMRASSHIQAVCRTVVEAGRDGDAAPRRRRLSLGWDAAPIVVGTIRE
jgi:hypothetical protein